MRWAQRFKEILRTYYIFLLKIIFLKFTRGLILTLSVYLWLYSPCGPWPLFKFFNLSLDGWSVRRKAASYTKNNTIIE
jgi:hypothetical protein